MIFCGCCLIPGSIISTSSSSFNRKHIHAFVSPSLASSSFFRPIAFPFPCLLSISSSFLFLCLLSSFSSSVFSFSSSPLVPPSLRLFPLWLPGCWPLCPVQVSGRSMVDHWRLSPNQRGHSSALCDHNRIRCCCCYCCHYCSIGLFCSCS